MEHIIKKIEAVLFTLGRIVTIKELMDSLKVTKQEVIDAMELIKEKYNEGNSGIVLIELDEGFQLVSNKKYFDVISNFIISSKRQTLTDTTMEVLSIIAYNPKITKSEIERIRGVNSDSQVSKLLECGLAMEIERLNLPGRPAAFGITEEFLKCMGIKSIKEMPEFEKIHKSKQVSVFDNKDLVGE